MKNKLKGLLVCSTVLLSFSLSPLAYADYIEEKDSVERMEQSSENKQEKSDEDSEENGTDSEDKTEENERMTESKEEELNVVRQKLDEIKASNLTASAKASRLLRIYTEQIMHSHEMNNSISDLTVEYDNKKLLLEANKEKFEKTLKTLEKKEKELEKALKEKEESEKKLEETVEQIKQLEITITKKKEVIAEKARTLQLQGDKKPTLLSVVLDSKSVSEAIRRAIALNQLAEAEKEFQDSLLKDLDNLETLEKAQVEITKELVEKSDKIATERDEIDKEYKELKKRKEELEEQTERLEQTQQNLSDISEGQLETITETSRELSNVVDGLLDMENDLKDIREKLLEDTEPKNQESNKKEIDEIDKLLEMITNLKIEQELQARQERELQARQATSLGTRDFSSMLSSRRLDTADLSEKQQKLVQFAQTQLGVPYVWGGVSWNSGLDCSGLTMNVYQRALGINIGRVTWQQETAGYQVPISDLQVGDLIFWGAIGNTTHVAIYVGNGEYIHAPQPGQSVTYSSWNIQGASTVRRIL